MSLGKQTCSEKSLRQGEIGERQRDVGEQDDIDKVNLMDLLRNQDLSTINFLFIITTLPTLVSLLSKHSLYSCNTYMNINE